MRWVARTASEGRTASTTVAALLLAAILAVPALGDPQNGPPSESPADGERPEQVPAAGDDRYATAAKVATSAYEDAEAVILATGEEFADALAGASLGGALDAPLLLTPSDLDEDGELPEVVLDAIDELGADTAYLLGGEGAISEAVADHLEDHTEADDTAINVERVRGGDRVETAAEVAREAAAQDAGAGTVEIDGEDVRVAFVATSEDFPDAVAAGPGAFATGAPMLLTGADELDETVEEALEELDVDKAFVLGGEAAVSDDVLAAVEELVGDATRLADEDRWGTAVAVAERFGEDGFDFPVEQVGVATGRDFADALAASSSLGRAEAPLVLADENEDGELPPAPAEYLEANGCEITWVHVFGGESAVGESVREQVLDFAACVADDSADPGPPEDDEDEEDEEDEEEEDDEDDEDEEDEDDD